MEPEKNSPETSTGMNKTMIIVGTMVIGIVVIVGGYLFLSNNQTQTPATTSTDSESQALTESTPIATASSGIETAQVIAVEGGNYYYKPNEITVKAGQKVTIQLTAVGMMHDFVVDELNVKAPVTQAGNTSSVEFTPAIPGEYEFYCSVGNHRAMGMKGTLIVE